MSAQLPDDSFCFARNLDAASSSAALRPSR
jgi:hypothetical protein